MLFLHLYYQKKYMSDTLQEALLLLGIGMITVFAVLFLVVLTGNLLVRLTNRWEGNAPAPGSKSSVTSDPIDPAVVAVITATVDVVTEGKGSISQIEPHSTTQ
jgi:oxaloacetate decarboxylase gamma subunit